MRKIKTLGLATVVALALMAVGGVSSAGASVFVTPNGGVTTIGGTLSGGNHVFGFAGGNIGCGTSTFGATTSAGTEHSQLTTSPQISCTWVNGQPAGWATNGCKFRFNANGIGVPGTVDIVGCESPMFIESFTCRREIGNQSGLGSVEYLNKEAGGVAYIEIVANLNSITYTGEGCGGTGTFSNGTFTGKWTAKATKPAGVPLRFEESLMPAPTLFGAEEAPVTITGQHVKAGTQRLSLGGNSLNCETYSLSGSSATVTASSISLTPQYKGCSNFVGPTPDLFVHMGSCKYVFYVSGKADIAACNNPLEGITITTFGCVTSVQAQSGLSGTLSYSNQGSGKLRTVAVSGKIEGVAGTRTGPWCTAQGAFSNGSITATTTLSAKNAGGLAQGFAVQ